MTFLIRVDHKKPISYMNSDKNNKPSSDIRERKITKRGPRKNISKHAARTKSGQKKLFHMIECVREHRLLIS